MTVPPRSGTAKASANNEGRNGQDTTNSKGPRTRHGPSSGRFPTGTVGAAAGAGLGGDQTANRSTTKISVSPGLMAGVGLWSP
jgi:hypothetical protein